MDESIDSTDTPTGMQQIRYCEYMYNMVDRNVYYDKEHVATMAHLFIQYIHTGPNYVFVLTIYLLYIWFSHYNVS